MISLGQLCRGPARYALVRIAQAFPHHDLDAFPQVPYGPGQFFTGPAGRVVFPAKKDRQPATLDGVQEPRGGERTAMS